MKSINIVIWDKCEIFSNGFADILNQHGKFQLAGILKQREDVEAFPHWAKVQILLINLNQIKEQTLSSLNSIKNSFNFKVIYFHPFESRQAVAKAFISNGDGFLSLEYASIEIFSIIASVHDRKRHFGKNGHNPGELQRMIKEYQREIELHKVFDNLNFKYHKILLCLDKKMDNQEIALQLNLSERTVETYVYLLKKENDLHNAMHLFEFAGKYLTYKKEFAN